MITIKKYVANFIHTDASWQFIPTKQLLYMCRMAAQFLFISLWGYFPENRPLTHSLLWHSRKPFCFLPLWLAANRSIWTTFMMTNGKHGYWWMVFITWPNSSVWPCNVPDMKCLWLLTTHGKILYSTLSMKSQIQWLYESHTTMPSHVTFLE